MKLFALCMAIILPINLTAFCGFYVAGAGAELFNEASQVILVRDGNKTVITMQNDFKGDVKEFAMVVPVPVVLKRKDIRTVSPDIFSYLNKYTAPRLAEYYDSNPCEPPMLYEMAAGSTAILLREGRSKKRRKDKKYKVKVEARYSIDEYDVVILSAKESNGLKRWLVDNGYHIPEQAEEVLAPYIKNNLKFFVVKVNLEKQEQQGFTALRPLQIRYQHDRFMLPIRLGMANAKGYQDLIVYAYTRNGRVETTNYRTAKIPADVNIPPSVKKGFGAFYKAVFDHAWEKAGRSAVMLEYAWDQSSSNYTKCDPCATTPPTLAQLQEAGVWWVKPRKEGGGFGASDYVGDLFITRLHARYNAQYYPEDLAFSITPNKNSFQGRYVIHHPATGDFDCEAGERYKTELAKRQKEEEENYAMLTGKGKDGKIYHDDSEDGSIGIWGPEGPNWPTIFGMMALLMGLITFPRLLQRIQNRLA